MFRLLPAQHPQSRQCLLLLTVFAWLAASSEIPCSESLSKKRVLRQTTRPAAALLLVLLTTIQCNF